MPKLHHSILQSLPSERLRIGDCVVDAAVREITPAGGSPHRVSLKAVDLLLVLVAHAGKVVSRETLLETVWPDTLPGDDVVTQAVAQLRKAFDSAEPVIETIAKHGYRLRAPIEWLDSPAAPALATAPVVEPIVAVAPPAPPRALRPALRLAAVLGVALLATAIWVAIGTSNRRGPAAADESPPAIAFEKITSAPGGEFAPSVSPDGALVVYSAYLEDQHRTVLMLQTTAPVEPRALTTPARGERDVMAAWSPDGREIAFARLPVDGRCQLMRVAAAGGDARPIGPCDGARVASRFSWHPDGKSLLMAGSMSGPAHTGAIQRLELATGRSRTLAYARGPNDIDISPAYSPDGRWIAFQRNISRGDIWRMPAAGGTPERLTKLEANLYGLSWAPDGNAIVFSAHEGLGPMLYRLALPSRKVTPLGIEGAMSPSVALKNPSLAFVIEDGRTALFRVPIAAPAGGARSAPEPVFASSGSELLPSVSPDGRQIVFASDRSGDLRLWWGQVGRPTSLRPIEGFTPFPRHPAVWDGDGQKLLMVGSEGGDEALFEIFPAGGRVRKLALPDGKPTFASYLPDPQHLLVIADRGAGRLGMTLYDRGKTPWQVRAQLDDVAMARFDPLGQRIIFVRTASWGVWQTDLALRAPTLLDNLRTGGDPSAPLVMPEAGFYVQTRRLVVSPAGTWVLGSDSDCNLRWIAVAAPASRTPAPCLDERGGALSGISFDAARRQLYYSYSTDGSQDIGWARLPR
ncbi:winged helix-turn-helix domain-containing protein [Lysobacter koreensis]|uniref:Winged helix-turn-helix domain-containing protein n=1 Tax=Lysobacter koreensis TaxID=266122 RepID=A0ABW2YN76_9GAMM